MKTTTYQYTDDGRRYSGVLVHPTCFPSPYGIGDLGQGAYDFIDFPPLPGSRCSSARRSCWKSAF